MKAEAIIQIRFPSERRAETVLEALKPETESSPTRRSTVKVRKEEDEIILYFTAKDITALRASINSYLWWIMLIDDTVSTVRSIEGK